jgi:hypothetical protein
MTVDDELAKYPQGFCNRCGQYGHGLTFDDDGAVGILCADCLGEPKIKRRIKVAKEYELFIWGLGIDPDGDISPEEIANMNDDQRSDLVVDRSFQ